MSKKVERKTCKQTWHENIKESSQASWQLSKKVERKTCKQTWHENIKESSQASWQLSKKAERKTCKQTWHENIKESSQAKVIFWARKWRGKRASKHSMDENWAIRQEEASKIISKSGKMKQASEKQAMTRH